MKARYALAAALLAAGPLTCLAAEPGIADSAAPGPVTWLAAGDSYSSGEGIRNSVGDCSQSPRAYGPRAADLLRTERGWTVSEVAMTACTGAVTTDFFNRANKSHPSQSDWSEQDEADGRFDVVTLSFGGNDIDFTSVIKECIGIKNTLRGYLTKGLGGGCKVTENELRTRIDALVAGHGSAAGSGPFGRAGADVGMADFYAQVAESHLAPGGVLVVAGYPRLFAPSGQWPSWRHDFCGTVTGAEGDLLGSGAEMLDVALRAAVSTASSRVKDGRSVVYVSRLDEFDNGGSSHSLCAQGTSWINGLGALWYAGRLESPFHPNEVGHQVTAEEVAGRVETALDGDPEPSAPPVVVAPEISSGAPSVSDGSIRYDPGDEIDTLCTVAWPTAPTYTSTSIVLTTACPNVPGQFQFVQISYPDPDLPITPSTGLFRMHGVIVDSATSTYGFTTLLVEADDIDLDP